MTLNTIQELDKSLTEVKFLITQSAEEVLKNDDFTVIQDSDSHYYSDDNNSSTSNKHSKLPSDKVEVKRSPLLCAYCCMYYWSIYRKH